MARAWLGTSKAKRYSYDLSKLTRHAAILGTTGSGKTVMGKAIIEEALASGVPVIALDPKGDIGSLGVVRKDFDFRPFGALTKAAASKLRDRARQAGIPSELVEKLARVRTRIYTPKSRVGLPVNLTPDLSAPKGFARLARDDPLAASSFVEPIAASLLSLAGVSKALEERAASFVAALLAHGWERGRDLDIPGLIERVKAPGIEAIGTLAVSEVVSDKERARLAAQLNTIVSSPAKRAWAVGEPLVMRDLLKPRTLSVFDLRWATSIEDKRYVAERVMSELYRELLGRGGSEKLRYVLYIDELAGLLPPPPASPPSKRSLELLIRQARAFGLGIVIATQNPGDIDARVFGNIGTRFIGRLRTAADLEKVATAMDIAPSELREPVSKLRAGGFVVSDAVDNRLQPIEARWLASFHRGPLTEREIGWINGGDAPEPAEPLPKTPNARSPKSAKRGTKTARKGSSKPAKKVSGSRIVRDSKKTRNATVRKTTHLTEGDADKRVKELLAVVKKHCDDVQLKVELSDHEQQRYTPHLRLVVGSKPFHGIDLPLQGPFVFDMTSKLIPIGNYLKGKTFSTYVPQDIGIDQHARSVLMAVTYARQEAKRELSGTFYESTIVPFASASRSEVEDANHARLSEELGPALRQIDAKSRAKVADLNDRIKALRQKRRSLTNKHRMHKARRAVTRALTDAKLKKRTAAMAERERRIAQIDREIDQLKSRIAAERSRAADAKEKKRAAAYQKAHTQVRTLRYRPTNDDLAIHAQVLLVRARASRR